MKGTKQSKGVISKDHQRVSSDLQCGDSRVQEMFGTQSPGVGLYTPKIDALKNRFPSFNISGSVKEDLYRYNREISKSPGPIYDSKVLNDITSPITGVCMPQSNFFFSL